MVRTGSTPSFVTSRYLIAEFFGIFVPIVLLYPVVDVFAAFSAWSSNVVFFLLGGALFLGTE